MVHWTNERKEKVNNALVGAKALFVDIYNNNRTPNNLIGKIEECDIMIGYSQKYRLYVAWNAYLHRGRNSASAQLLRQTKCSSFFSTHAELKDNISGYEKQVFIAPDFLIQFCNDWISYLMPTEADKNGYDIKFMWADRDHPIPMEIQCFEQTEFTTKPRSTYIHQTYERDSSFRKKILKDYEHKCAICRCEVESVLEAHHILYVSKNGSDALHNGICLCRNHHRMIHSELITLNTQDHTYEVNASIAEDPLTKWAIETFHKELLLPISRR